jgi:hypothetical protein
MTAAFGGTGTLHPDIPAAFGAQGGLADLTIYTPDPETATGSLSVLVGSPYPEPGEFPDWEHVLVDLLTPIAYTCQTLPPSAEALQAQLPLFWVHRDGGGLDFNAITDTAHVRVTAMSHLRSASWRLARQAREAILTCPGGDVNGVLVDWAEEITGEMEIGDNDPLNRNVEIAFRMTARRQ